MSSSPGFGWRPQSVVVGIADHNGWAILVSVAAVNGVPAVVDRRRVKLIEEGVPSQPYHHETLALGNLDAERLLRQVTRSIAGCTAAAFDNLSADLLPRYRVAGVTIRQPPLEHVPASVEEVHRSYNVTCRADGMLYHTAICAAVGERRWKLVLHRRGEEMARAADALRTSVHAIEEFVGDQRRTLKPPWTAEYRNAFAAAIGSLKQTTRLRLP